MSHPTIAVCLIVRNEAKTLPRCLASLENQVDSIYVTDTGSTDATVEIAKSFGAVVRSFPWVDDFAAARNASIADVREDWILTLDADDVFPPGEIVEVRKQLSDPAACAASLRYSVISNYTPLRATKLIRNGLEARFAGIIHESLNDWLVARCAAGWRQQELDVDLVHTGYTAAAMPGKIARNLPLLQAEWLRGKSAGTTDRQFYIGAELGLALAYADRKEEACEFLSELLKDVVSSEPTATYPSGLQVLINLLWVLSEAGNQSAALAVVQAVESSLSALPVYQLHRGLTELASGNHGTARTWLERFRSSPTDNDFTVSVPIEFLGAGLWRALGLCHMGEHDYKQAVQCFTRCIQLEPQNQEHQLRLMVAKSMLRK